MTEELLQILEENRKTPLEDKIYRTIDSFEHMFNLFLEVTEVIDFKLISLQEQIDSLETRFIRLEQEKPSNQIKSIIPTNSQMPKIKKENLENPRIALMDELRELLKKKKKN